MAIFRGFRTPKHQQYDYKPRFWNPEKEALEERIKQVEERKSGNTESAKERISAGFKRGNNSYMAYGEKKSFRSAQTRRSNITLFIVIILLALLTYLFLNIYLPEFEQILEQKGYSE